MVMLVTLQQASDTVKRDQNHDDNHLTMLIEAASEAVLNYLKDGRVYERTLGTDGLPVLDSNGDFVYELDSSGDRIPLAIVQRAVLYLVGVFYKNPDSDPDKEWQPGFLPAPVTAMLYPLRTPALA